MPDKENFAPEIPGVESSGNNLEKYKIPILVGVGVLVLGVIAFLAFTFLESDPPETTKQPVTLEFWDAYDDRNTYQPLLDKYEEENPHVTIQYKTKKPDTSFQKPEEAYHNLITEALAAGDGPDVYTVQNSWIPMEKDKLASLNSVHPDINPALLLGRYPDVVRFDFFVEEKIGLELESQTTEEILYALPLSIDTLALYYNKDHFANAGISNPPETWEEFVDAVKRLRRVEDGDIIRAGVAMGASDTHASIQGGDNVNNAVDILSLLMLQSGVTMNDENSNYVVLDRRVTKDGTQFYPGRDALQFYTSFADPDSENYTWDPYGPYSIDAFSQSEASMMINYQDQIDVVRDKNQFLDFDIAPIPQPKDNFSHENYASYWGLAVSKASKHQEEAWNFILWLSEEENNRAYLERSNRPPAQKSFVSEWQHKPDGMGIFARQTLTARSWVRPEPFETEKIIESAIKEMVTNEDAMIANVLGRMTTQINSLWPR